MKLSILSIIAAGILSPLKVESQIPEVWTFSDCLDYAHVHNISIRQSELNSRVTDETLAAAKAQWQPTLDFGTSHSYSNSPWGEGIKNSLGGNFNFSAGWTVYDGGVRSGNIRLAETQQKIDALNTDDLSNSIDTQLLSAYLNILYADESINIFKNALEISTAQADRARQLMEAGRISKVDYSQLEAQRAQDEYNLTNAQSQYATRILELKNLLELTNFENLQIAPIGFSDRMVLASLPDISTTYSLAIGLDPQLKMYALQNDQADINEEIAYAGKKPKIALTAGVGTSYFVPGGNFGSQLRNAIGEQVGISLSLPIFDQRKTKTAVAKAKLEKLGVDLNMEQRLTQLSQSIESWYVSARESQSKYKAAISQKEAAELSDSLVNEQFKLGLVNPVELLTAHNNLLDASHSVIQAKYMSVLALRMIEFYRTYQVSL